jgi:hypothetical protein
MINHNVETCIKKEQPIVAVTKTTQQNQKPKKTSSYACHICSLNGHKMTKYPKSIEMYKMFHGKFMTITEIQLVFETQTIIANVNVSWEIYDNNRGSTYC